MIMMTNDFPNLPSNSKFPNVGNIDVFKYDNQFDYARFDAVQMELQLCTVPWDMGEVHIGNRTLSGVGNVVYFETKENRDAWFAAIPDDECYRFETKFKELHRDHVIDVPVPFDMCAHHNYLVVRYAKLANENSPVIYEGDEGLREWFWFVREVEFVAPNTTRLHLLEDAFQTWIYDVNVSGMVLERGHAPMFDITADEYLDNPIENNVNLLTEDVNYGSISQVKHADAVVLNSGDMYVCVATTADPTGSWGSKLDDDWQTPASAWYSVNGVLTVKVFAMKAIDITTFLSNVNADYPQFKQTVQGVFFVSKDMLTFGASFTFADTTCHTIESNRHVENLTTIDKGMFGYDSEYANIAKLYTFPYAQLEITDENGNVDVIHIEDTTGKIDVNVGLSLAYPFINIDAHLLGAGGSNDNVVKFKNLDERSFQFGGQWYETLRTWKVPIFAVILSGAKTNDYGTHFDREQRVIDYNTAYDNAYASAATTKTNADASADANKDNVNTITSANKNNADALADTQVSNAIVTTTCNNAVTTRSNTSANRASTITQTYNNNIKTADNTIIDVTSLSTIAANEMQGSISASGQAASAIVGAIGSAMSGNPGELASGPINGLIGAGTTLASTHVSSGLTATQAAGAKAGNTSHATISNAKTEDDTDNQTSTATAITGYQNTAVTDSAANSSATIKANATRTKNAENTAASNTQTTEKANNTRTKDTANANATRDRSRAINAVSNSVSQAALNAPSIFGSFANGDSASTKPMALFCNIVTQSKSAIHAAGDEFLRYGYMLDRQYHFDGNWNKGKYFTYWKLRDFWVSNLNVPDMYMDRLRFFLYGGVTIWRNPKDIGNVTIYDNFD